MHVQVSTRFQNVLENPTVGSLTADIQTLKSVWKLIASSYYVVYCFKVAQWGFLYRWPNTITL